jgi:molybdopterin-guanine dinucleotide biosynthesis protein A
MVGLVLAGGAGRRMGAPKPLLRWDGAPLVRWHVRALQARCATVRVVAGAHAAGIREALVGLRPAAVVVDHPRWAETDMAGSALRGLRGLDAEALVIVSPVDAAPAPTWVLDRLQAGADLHGAVGTRAGRDGHPLIARVGLLRDALGAGGTLRSAVEGVPRVRLPWPDLHRNLNTPEDWSAWLGDMGSPGHPAG